MATRSEDGEDPKAPAPQPAPPAKAEASAFVPQPVVVPHRRNQMLGLMLVGVIASIFIIVLALVLLLHYADTHHVLAQG